MSKEKPIGERVSVLETQRENDSRMLEEIHGIVTNGLTDSIKRCVAHVDDSEKKIEDKKDYWRITIRGMTLAGFGAILTIAIAVIKYLWLVPRG